MSQFANLTGQDEATQKARYAALKGRKALILSGSMFVQFMSNGMKDQFRYASCREIWRTRAVALQWTKSLPFYHQDTIGPRHCELLCFP
jgi:hypothetical protein